MRRFLSLFAMLMLCSVLAFAQTRVVSGKVIDKDGGPVAFASIKIKGSTTGTQADGSGAFTIKVKATDVLEISSTNFKAQDVPVGEKEFLVATMEKTGTLSEVVVTSAFGIKRNARSSASNVQNVNSEQLI